MRRTFFSRTKILRRPTRESVRHTGTGGPKAGGVNGKKRGTGLLAGSAGGKSASPHEFDMRSQRVAPDAFPEGTDQGV